MVVRGGHQLIRYEVLDHTADTAIVAYGATPAQVFENAAFGMFDLMFDLAAVPAERSRPVVATGDTREELLVTWLSELLAEAEIHDLAFSSFTVEDWEEGAVVGSACGAPAARFELRGPPVKAVTYHDLAVVETPEGLWARVVFDV